jgi:hypothetical protein
MERDAVPIRRTIITTVCVILLIGVEVKTENLQTKQSTNEAWKVADRMIESIGGQQVWAVARSLYVRELAYPASVQGPLTAEFWRDLEKPAYRSVITGPGLRRETRWNEQGGWVIRDGVKTTMTTEKLKSEITGWRNEPYILYHKLALRDPSLHLAVSEGNRLEIFERSGGPMLCWFVVDSSGALLMWGNLYEGEVNEHVYGPLRDFGKVRMPAWGTSTTGSWRFEYQEVVPSAEPLDFDL